MSVVRDLRERVHLTQQLLSDLSGITAQTISRYETGRRSPTLKALDQLAEAAGLRVEVSFVPITDRTDHHAGEAPAAIATPNRPRGPMRAVRQDLGPR